MTFILDLEQAWYKSLMFILRIPEHHGVDKIGVECTNDDSAASLKLFVFGILQGSLDSCLPKLKFTFREFDTRK